MRTASQPGLERWAPRDPPAGPSSVCARLHGAHSNCIRREDEGTELQIQHRQGEVTAEGWE